MPLIHPILIEYKRDSCVTLVRQPVTPQGRTAWLRAVFMHPPQVAALLRKDIARNRYRQALGKGLGSGKSTVL